MVPTPKVRDRMALVYVMTFSVVSPSPSSLSAKFEMGKQGRLILPHQVFQDAKYMRRQGKFVRVS